MPVEYSPVITSTPRTPRRAGRVEPPRLVSIGRSPRAHAGSSCVQWFIWTAAIRCPSGHGDHGREQRPARRAQRPQLGPFRAQDGPRLRHPAARTARTCGGDVLMPPSSRPGRARGRAVLHRVRGQLHERLLQRGLLRRSSCSTMPVLARRPRRSARPVSPSTSSTPRSPAASTVTPGAGEQRRAAASALGRAHPHRRCRRGAAR